MRELLGVAPNHGIWTGWTIYSQGLESEWGLNAKRQCQEKISLSRLSRGKKKIYGFSESKEIAWGC